MKKLRSKLLVLIILGSAKYYMPRILEGQEILSPGSLSNIIKVLSLAIGVMIIWVIISAIKKYHMKKKVTSPYRQRLKSINKIYSQSR